MTAGVLVLALVVASDGGAPAPVVARAPWAATRRALLAAGWKPRPTRLPVGDGRLERDVGFAKQLVALGYVEVEVCAGTGTSPCIFNFVDAAGRCLRVFTSGEQPRELVVATSRFECPPAEAR